MMTPEEREALHRRRSEVEAKELASPPASALASTTPGRGDYNLFASDKTHHAMFWKRVRKTDGCWNAGQGSGLSPYLINLHRGGHVARLKAYLDSVIDGRARYVTTGQLAAQSGISTHLVGGALAAMREDPDFSVSVWSRRARRGNTTWRVERR